MIRRYLLFFAGMLLVALGISVITKAGLGTSPISSVPYSLSLILPRLTMGEWTIVFNYLQIAAQWVMLGKDAKKHELVIQLVLTVVLGYLIDFFLFLLGWLAPAAYPLRIVTLLAGCMILAFGAYLENVGGVVMLAGDAFVRAFGIVTKRSFGSARFVTDILWTSISAVLCLVFLHELIGVREGTVIATLLVGNLVKLYSKKLDPVFGRLLKTA